MALRPLAALLLLVSLAGCTLIDLSQLGSGSGAGQTGGESSAGNAPNGGSPNNGGGPDGGSSGVTQGGGPVGGAPPGESYADCLLDDMPAVYFRADSPNSSMEEANLGSLGGTAIHAGLGNTHTTFPGLIADDDLAAQYVGRTGAGGLGLMGAETVFGGFKPFSIEVWLKTPADINDATLVGYEVSGNRLQLRLKKRLSFDGMDAFELRILLPSNEERYVTHYLDLEAPAEQLFHLVAVYRQTGDTVFAGDGSADDMLLYLNGEPTGDLAGNDPIFMPQITALLTVGNGFEGVLDEIAVYPRELSAADVARHYAFGLNATVGCDGR